MLATFNDICDQSKLYCKQAPNFLISTQSWLLNKSEAKFKLVFGDIDECIFSTICKNSPVRLRSLSQDYISQI